MSQQKQLVVLAICVLGLVAMVSAQSFDWQNCQKRARSSLEQYRQTLISASRKFASNMQDAGESAADTSAFNSDIDELISIWGGMMNQGGSFDAGRVSSAYMQSIQRAQSMMMTAFRMYSSMPQVTMTNYMEFAQTLFTAQSTMMTSMSSGCMPSFRKALDSQ